MMRLIDHGFADDHITRLAAAGILDLRSFLWTYRASPEGIATITGLPVETIRRVVDSLVQSDPSLRAILDEPPPDLPPMGLHEEGP